jgi:hypothetical protein
LYQIIKITKLIELKFTAKKNMLLMALVLAFVCSFTFSTQAQQSGAAKKYENPQWKRVDLLAFNSGTAGRDREIIHR